MDTFGNAQAKVIPLDLSENQFQIYNKISRNYSHSFLFESLSGPEVLAETSVMGFDPKIIFKGYSDKVEIIENNNTRIIKTNDPFIELKKLLDTLHPTPAVCGLPKESSKSFILAKKKRCIKKLTPLYPC